jgi:hypothetical protein
MRRQASKLHRAPRTVVGYHGCSRETVRRILEGEPFIPSTMQYDWLGDGIYFWEYGPFRAYEWAEGRFGPDAIEFYYQLQAEEGRAPFQTARGCYPEGEPAFPGSRILSRAHVQVVVRDDSCLTHLRMVRW